MMWLEARKQEKKIKGLMVDYKKRAERRRNYYEMIKTQPQVFLRVTGSFMKIQLDPAVSAAAESSRSMMPWPGDSNILIDRFDVRANLDYIPDYKHGSSLPEAAEMDDDMKCNYDRYRIIVQNECAGISEETALRQIEVDEKFGDVTKSNKSEEDKKKQLANKKAAIGFNYTDSSAPAAAGKRAAKNDSGDEGNDDELDDVDLDMAFDIDQITSEVKQQLDVKGTLYGMAVGEFSEQLRKDKQDEQALRDARIAEEEKAALSGRKSRKERRIYKENLLRLRDNSPPSYAQPRLLQRGSPKYDAYSSSESGSRSPSPRGNVKEFITSFGGEESGESSNLVELPPHLRVGSARKLAGMNASTLSWKPTLKRSDSPEFGTRSRSRSPVSPPRLEPPPVVRSYRRESSKSSFSDSDDEVEKDRDRRSYRPTSSVSGKSGANAASSDSRNKASSSSGGKLTAQERLKKKMQAALTKTYKADKKSQSAKQEQVKKQLEERQEDIRSQAEDQRRRDYRYSSSSSRYSSNSRAVRSRSASRSRSRSPQRSAYHNHRGSHGYSSSSGYRSHRRSRSRSRDRYRSYR